MMKYPMRQRERKPSQMNLGREQPIFLLHMIGMEEARKVVGGTAPSFF